MCICRMGRAYGVCICRMGCRLQVRIVPAPGAFDAALAAALATRRPVFVLVAGEKGPDGRSWCGDCK